MPGESYRRRLESLLLCLIDVFWALINSLVCWFCTRAVGIVQFQIHVRSRLVKRSRRNEGTVLNWQTTLAVETVVCLVARADWLIAVCHSNLWGSSIWLAWKVEYCNAQLLHNYVMCSNTKESSFPELKPAHWLVSNFWRKQIWRKQIKAIKTFWSEG